MKTKVLPSLGGTVFGLMFLYWIFCLNHIQFNEVGISYNSRTGEIVLQEKNGWYQTSPFVRIVTIDTTPFIVDLMPHLSGGAKVINQKLVRINPTNILDLVKLEGFHSFLGNKDAMTAYAFAPTNYSFLEILREVK